MSKFTYQVTQHTIDGQEIELAKLTPTNGDPSARRLSVTDREGLIVEVTFDHEGFKLLKAIIDQY